MSSIPSAGRPLYLCSGSLARYFLLPRSTQGGLYVVRGAQSESEWLLAVEARFPRRCGCPCASLGWREKFQRRLRRVTSSRSSAAARLHPVSSRGKKAARFPPAEGYPRTEARVTCRVAFTAQ